MIYSIHKNDLTSDAPRVLPAPMSVGALFLGAGIPLADDVTAFLDQHGGNPGAETSRWYLQVWDRSDSDAVAARATFIWSNGNVACEAITVEPSYSALDLPSYLQRLGRGLWGV